MQIKYRVHEVAKDLNVDKKEIIDLLDRYFSGEQHKHATALTEEELNVVFEDGTAETITIDDQGDFNEDDDEHFMRAWTYSENADGTYDIGIASHTPGALPLWFTASRFAEGNNIFHVADLTPYTDYISAIQGEADQTRRQALVTEFQAFLARERPFIPLWFSRTLHVQSPTVDGIDYPSSTFSNENVWDWEYRG